MEGPKIKPRIISKVSLWLCGRGLQINLMLYYFPMCLNFFRLYIYQYRIDFPLTLFLSFLD